MVQLLLIFEFKKSPKSRFIQTWTSGSSVALPAVVARALAALRNKSTVSSCSSDDMKLEVNLKLSGVGECWAGGSRAE